MCNAGNALSVKTDSHPGDVLRVCVCRQESVSRSPGNAHLIGAVPVSILKMGMNWPSKNQEDVMRDFVEGFLKGARETPRGFFAPAIALWRLLLRTTESLTREQDVR